MTEHVITTIHETGNQLTRECSCGGWWTIAEVPEPDHHTPLAQREADHIRHAAAVEDGTVWNTIPAGHAYRVHLHRRHGSGEPNQVVVTAVWTGGSCDVMIWPWTEDGLSDADEWCNGRHVTWRDSGYLVQPGQLLSAGARV